ncbi:ATP-dependent helicase [Burkholderia pseudomallei]|uniref:ATP-dependent helicase n=1 Tax=Burkholderia pseudomallei TaxID=28450 RepID=UPI0021F7983C|nr:ATP-dependent helicase [Burkholderia pseudomallei]MCW0024617.1 ATP-dependent helicase [Burkholderia pseudomallei]MCW0156080.1 ATP-dependent helicase [Burkholderia pseudomallei]
MNKSWFRSIKELDDDQKAFIKLPAHGKHSLVGPPGSGKTNLLLLRAEFLAGTGEKNVLIVTYTRALADFIRTGIGSAGLISPDQIKTYHSWATDHIFQYLGQRAIQKGADFDDKTRADILALVLEANGKLPANKLYSAIFVDEAQDLTCSELEALLSLSDNVCICGDGRQGIYQKDGLDVASKLGLQQHTLKRHFRIGQRVARVADRLMPPTDGQNSLEATSNYNPKDQGESSAKLHPCDTRDTQFAKMLEFIRVQLDAFTDDTIGVFCGTRDALTELREKFNGTDIADKVAVHGVDADATFMGGRPIHVLTIHGAKGTEFRAVHMYAVEDLARYPLNRRRLGFTAITRAKTALNAYRTGETNKALENAFSEPKHFDLEDLLPGDA